MSNFGEIKTFGEHALLIEWSNNISDHNHTQVATINKVLRQKFSEFIIETTPSYQSLAVFLKNDVDTSLIIESIYHILHESFSFLKKENRTVNIPVCYDEEFGLDLQSLSQTHELSTESIIAHHTKPLYPVRFIGFLPGFPYLEGLNPLLATPRKERPRSVVTAGSVGIAGNQTGVYPMESPGGWNIIGRSPIALFDIQNTPPSLLKIGGLVKFNSISKTEYNNIQKAIIENSYELKTTSKND